MKKFVMVLNLLAICCWASEKSPHPLEKSASASSQIQDDPQLVKIIQIPVTIYRDRCAQNGQPMQYDPVAWAAIVNKVKAFEQGTFSLSALNETIAFMVTTSIPAQGIWGSAPITYINDSEMIDGPKK